MFLCFWENKGISFIIFMMGIFLFTMLQSPEKEGSVQH